jgi:hypothetical protein
MGYTHRSHGFLAALAIAAFASLSAPVSAVDRMCRVVARAAVRAWRWAVDMVLAPLATTIKVVRNLPGPAVALIAAKQFLLRQIKRDRPVCMPGWRMCPSS